MKSTDIIKIENLSPDSQSFDIRWRVTTLCNYQCDFCIQGNPLEHLKQSEGESAQLREKICTEVIRLIEGLQGYDSVKLSLIGGEVTILHDFPEIMEKLALCRFPGRIRLDITTNFSRDTAYFCRLCDIIQKNAKEKKRSLLIGTSFYPAYVTKQQFADKLRAVYEHCGTDRYGEGEPGILPGGAGNTVSLSVGIPLLEDADYDELIRMRDEFKDTDIRIMPIHIRNYYTNISSETIKKLIRHEEKHIRITDISGGISMYHSIQALGAALEDRDSFCPRGYMCDSGIRNIWIDSFGRVKRCPAIGSTMFMGNILDGSFHRLEAPQICTSDHCSCSQYRWIEKTSNR